MYSPGPIETAPAPGAAAPVSTIVCADPPPPPRPAISEAFVTRPSTAPNTVGRSQPPDTSRWPCDQPAASAAVPTASEGSGLFSSATCQTIPAGQPCPPGQSGSGTSSPRSAPPGLREGVSCTGRRLATPHRPVG